AAELKYFSTLRSRGNADRCLAVDGRHLDLCTEHELRIRDEHLGVKVLTVALEALIFLDFEDDDDIAASSATKSGVPRPAHRHVLAGRDARGDIDRQLGAAAHAPFSTALLARRT